MKTLTLMVKRLAPDARLPTKAHPDDAGWDLYAYDGDVIDPGYSRTFQTGIAVALPDGWYAQIHDRSSLAASGIVVVGGVIDPGYRGQWYVTLVNVGRGRQRIDPGERIAQFVLHRVPHVWISAVEELTPTDRGAGGFGSTGA